MPKTIQVDDETFRAFAAVREVLGVNSDTLIRNLLRHMFGVDFMENQHYLDGDDLREIEDTYGEFLAALHDFGAGE